MSESTQFRTSKYRMRSTTVSCSFSSNCNKVPSHTIGSHETGLKTGPRDQYEEQLKEVCNIYVQHDLQ